MTCSYCVLMGVCLMAIPQTLLVQRPLLGHWAGRSVTQPTSSSLSSDSLVKEVTENFTSGFEFSKDVPTDNQGGNATVSEFSLQLEKMEKLISDFSDVVLSWAHEGQAAAGKIWQLTRRNWILFVIVTAIADTIVYVIPAYFQVRRWWQANKDKILTCMDMDNGILSRAFEFDNSYNGEWKSIKIPQDASNLVRVEECNKCDEDADEEVPSSEEVQTNTCGDPVTENIPAVCEVMESAAVVVPVVAPVVVPAEVPVVVPAWPPLPKETSKLPKAMGLLLRFRERRSKAAGPSISRLFSRRQTPPVEKNTDGVKKPQGDGDDVTRIMDNSRPLCTLT